MADDERWKPMAFVKHGAAGSLVHGGITSRPEVLDNALPYDRTRQSGCHWPADSTRGAILISYGNVLPGVANHKPWCTLCHVSAESEILCLARLNLLSLSFSQPTDLCPDAQCTSPGRHRLAERTKVERAAPQSLTDCDVRLILECGCIPYPRRRSLLRRRE